MKLCSKCLFTDVLMFLIHYCFTTLHSYSHLYFVFMLFVLVLYRHNIHITSIEIFLLFYHTLDRSGIFQIWGPNFRVGWSMSLLAFICYWDIVFIIFMIFHYRKGKTVDFSNLDFSKRLGMTCNLRTGFSPQPSLINGLNLYIVPYVYG